MDRKRKMKTMLWFQVKACFIVLHLLLALPLAASLKESEKDFLRDARASVHISHGPVARFHRPGQIKSSNKTDFPFFLLSAHQALASLRVKVSPVHATPSLSFLLLNPNTRARSPPSSFV